MDESREYAVGWVSLALINAGLAQAKGRRGLAWFALSLLLGPAATLILVAFIRPPEPGPEPTPLEFVEKNEP
jgi:hypothetical protein